MSWSEMKRRDALRGLMGVAAMIAGAPLVGCGYRPLYATSTRGGVSTEMAAVKIGLIPDRIGQRLRNNLLDRMNPAGEPASPRYRLDVALKEAVQDVGVRKDETSTRANYILSADYRLIDATTGRVLFRASSQRIASYNISRDDFSTISAANAARQRIATDLADEITTRVAIFLNRRQSAARS
jgi:LPS-assembly lipoprotein